MKKFFLMLGVVSLVIMGLSSSAFSYSFGQEEFSPYKNYVYTYGTVDYNSLDPAQGTYLGTVYDGNDDVETLEAVLRTLGWIDPCITFYGKDEAPYNNIWTPEL